jgi:hypothetical protein
MATPRRNRLAATPRLSLDEAARKLSTTGAVQFESYPTGKYLQQIPVPVAETKKGSSSNTLSLILVRGPSNLPSTYTTTPVLIFDVVCLRRIMMNFLRFVNASDIRPVALPVRR